MYRCAEVVRLVSSDEYLRLGLLKRLQIRLHLAMCRNCSKYVRQLHDLARAVRSNGEAVPEAEIESAKDRILHRLSGK